MAQKNRKPKTLTIRRDDQRRAFASPLRLELIGLFVDGKPLSVADMAERMGRPASAIHYHVRLMRKAGLLKHAGDRRSGRKPEALYVPVADLFEMEHSKGGSAAAAENALKTMSAAFRMAESDMRFALTDPDSRSTGPQRNLFGARVHCRLSRKDLTDLNRNLRAILKKLAHGQRAHENSKTDTFVSLTIALMPLRNREVKP